MRTLLRDLRRLFGRRGQLCSAPAEDDINRRTSLSSSFPSAKRLVPTARMYQRALFKKKWKYCTYRTNMEIRRRNANAAPSSLLPPPAPPPSIATLFDCTAGRPAGSQRPVHSLKGCYNKRFLKILHTMLFLKKYLIYGFVKWDLILLFLKNLSRKCGGHSIAPKTTSANTASASP